VVALSVDAEATFVAGDLAVLNLTKLTDDDAVLVIVGDHTVLHEAAIADEDPVQGIVGRFEISYQIAGAGEEKNAEIEAHDLPVLDRGPLPGCCVIRDPGRDYVANAVGRPGNHVAYEVDRDAIVGHHEAGFAANEICGQ
jgi:hypothetical protein